MIEPIKPLQLIGGDADLCGPDGCAIPTNHPSLAGQAEPNAEETTP